MQVCITSMGLVHEEHVNMITWMLQRANFQSGFDAVCRAERRIKIAVICLNEMSRKLQWLDDSEEHLIQQTQTELNSIKEILESYGVNLNVQTGNEKDEMTLQLVDCYRMNIVTLLKAQAQALHEHSEKQKAKKGHTESVLVSNLGT